MELLQCRICYKTYIKKDYRKKGHKKTKCNSCNVIEARRKRKKECIEYKGGKCKICGYNKCISSLVFHHVDPNKKDFGISEKGISRSWIIVKKELDKCVLLCQNCHCETHENMRNSIPR